MLSNEFSLPEYTKIDVGWGFVPDPTEGAYSAPPDPLAGFNWFQGGASQQEGNEGEGKDEGEGGKRGREGKGGIRGKLGGNSALVVGGIHAPGYE